jgi:uncharacterized protein
MTFRMPTERDVPSTGLEVAFPDEHPITSLRVKPKAGWTYEIVRAPLDEPIEAHGRQITERVSRIVWTATGEGVGPTEFEEFEVSGGPMPEVERLVIPAIQTYAGGEVVRWIEESAEGGEEPELAAPVLELAAAAASEDGQGGGDAAQEAPATEPAAAESSTNDGLAVAALAVAVLALLAALAGLLRRRT